jgi:hypothetical protein
MLCKCGEFLSRIDEEHLEKHLACQAVATRRSCAVLYVRDLLTPLASRVARFQLAGLFGRGQEIAAARPWPSKRDPLGQTTRPMRWNKRRHGGGCHHDSFRR